VLRQPLSAKLLMRFSPLVLNLASQRLVTYCSGTDAVGGFETVVGQQGAAVVFKYSERKWHVTFVGSDFPPGTRTGISPTKLASLFRALDNELEPWLWPVPIP
jgi:hypothetical protein